MTTKNAVADETSVKKSTARKTPKKTTEVKKEQIEETLVEEVSKTTDETISTSSEKIESSKPIIPKEVDIHSYISVYNGFHGKLVYQSRRTGELYEWDSYGDVQDLEIRDLKDAKSSSKKMFINNWFMFAEEDAWIIDYLGIRQYYPNAVSIDKFDEIFDLPSDELEARIAAMPSGQKKSILYRASELIKDGEIDSLKTIAALERSLGVELIEK